MWRSCISVAGDHFVIVLRKELSLKFKGLYMLNLDSGQVSGCADASVCAVNYALDSARRL
jgi:hypothetical protein